MLLLLALVIRCFIIIYFYFHNSLPYLELTLCELERRLLLFNDYESINRWERQTVAIVHQYAKEQRQRIASSWPILTIN
jgi:hypothetical protein